MESLDSRMGSIGRGMDSMRLFSRSIRLFKPSIRLSSHSIRLAQRPSELPSARLRLSARPGEPFGGSEALFSEGIRPRHRMDGESSDVLRIMQPYGKGYRLSQDASGRRKRNPLWWVYFGYYVAMLVAGIYMMPRADLVSALGGASTLLDVIGLVCFIGFLLSKPILVRAVWAVFTILFFLKVAIAFLLFLRTLVAFPWTGSREDYITLIGLAGVLLGVPALFAFWRYSFDSPAIWTRGKGAPSRRRP